MRDTGPQFLRFLIVGGVNTAVTYAIFVGLALVIPVELAYTAAYLVGLLWAVWGTARFVFRAKASWKKLGLFAASYVSIYLVGRFIIFLADPRNLREIVITTVLLVAVTTPLGFLAGKLLLNDREAPRTQVAHSPEEKLN